MRPSTLLKNSSVALTIGVAELTFQTRQIETYTAKAFEALAAGTIIYLVLCLDHRVDHGAASNGASPSPA